MKNDDTDRRRHRGGRVVGEDSLNWRIRYEVWVYAQILCAMDLVPAACRSAGTRSDVGSHDELSGDNHHGWQYASTPIGDQAWIGDFDEMLKRRMIRVYVPYSRSLYFVDKGRERGLAAELIRDFERWVNQKHKKTLGKRPVTVYIVAASRDKLLTDLNQGLADIAVGNLTVTEERLKLVDFVAPTTSSSTSKSS